jgi:hypothetical protein
MNEWDDQREDFFLKDYLAKARRLSLIPNDESQLITAARGGREGQASAHQVLPIYGRGDRPPLGASQYEAA